MMALNMSGNAGGTARDGVKVSRVVKTLVVADVVTSGYDTVT